ncbi:MAG: argininosuccinate lyase [bacterium]
MKLWGGRFAKPTAKVVEEYTASIQFDRKLYRQDIKGSIAHATMLGKVGILTAEERDTIIQGLKGILADIEAGRIEFKVELEDIHMNIEKVLTERIGPLGGKLHTARSRNDQVALDVHLYVKEEIKEVLQGISHLQQAFVEVAENNLEVIMPGYTHLQRAQPILFAHHMMAYYAMLERDYGRMLDCAKRADMLPLGAGALAGTSFPIDREYVAELLDFSAVYDNSLDAVSDRDFVLEFLSAASVMMMHLSRLSEELVLWSSVEFSFIELDDGFSTGSSIMPQKKNPDVAELVRGKTGRVYGNLMQLLTVMKSLPLAYNKDMQEDKESLFDTMETVKSTLQIYTDMLLSMKVRTDKMYAATKEGFVNATDVADYLAARGIPFRQCHEIVGRLVLDCIKTGKSIDDLTLAEFQEYSPSFAEDILEVIKVANCVKVRKSLGGTAPEQVERFIAKAKKQLADRE